MVFGDQHHATHTVKRFGFRDHIRPFLCEFVGVFFLCTIYTWSCSAAKADSALPLPLIYGGALAAVTYAGRQYSNAHFNPAVTFGFLVTRGISVGHAVLYMLSQVAGALFAGLVASYNVSETFPQPSKDFGFGTHFAAEVFGVMTVVIVVCNSHVTTDSSGYETSRFDCYKQSFAGFVIGSTVTAWNVAVGPISGGLFNPAVAMVDVAYGNYGNAWMYWSSSFVGALVGVFVFILTNPNQMSFDAPLFTGNVLNKAVEQTQQAITFSRYITGSMLQEFVGTLLFCTLISFCIGAKATSPLAAYAIGSLLMALVYSGAHISGGHYNPAVSFAVFLRGSIWLANERQVRVQRFWSFLSSVAAQCGGAMVAASITLALAKDGELSYGFPKFADDAEFKTKFLTEFLGAALLCMSVLHACTVPRKSGGNGYFGFAVGFSVAVSIVAFGDISGGCFNPAVALLQAFSASPSALEIWCYWSAPFVAAIAAAFGFWMVVEDEDGSDESLPGQQGEERKGWCSR